jgi:hypothetical protein
MSFSSVPHKDTLFNVINRTADIAVRNEIKKIAETAWSEHEVSIEKINSLEKRGANIRSRTCYQRSESVFYSSKL